MAIVKRLDKGSELTYAELDGNFTDLDTRVTTLEGATDNDSQTLSFSSPNLSISGGNSVDLSALQDGTGIALTDLSVTTNPVGTAALVYDNNTGVFTYTPPDLSSVSSTTAETIEFTVHNDSGGVLTKGEVVYISGLNGNTPEVSKAQANSSTTMPAFGIVKADIANTADGTVITFGSCPSHDAADFGETGITFGLGDTLYVSATEAGKLTNVAPAGESNLIQNIGKIERATPTTNMTIKVGGAGRTNATPNLNDGNIFIGNAQNQSSTASFNSTVDAHLNTGTATSGQVLSWTGTDYDWVAQSGGGGAETDPVVGAITGIVKADGAGNISAAVAGTDYSTFDGAFGSLSGTPTTLAGYGITDALTAGGALTGSSLEAVAVGAGVADGNDLAITGGDATELNSTGGDANITGGSGALAPGNVNIGASQTALVTIGSGSNNVDFPNGTAVDFTGATVTGLNFYTDSDVDTHLNTSTASSSEVLSWNGSDYAWVAQSGGGGGSGLQSRSTATATTTSIPDGSQVDLNITGFKSYALLSITTDRAARVRLYVSSATRSADAGRAEGVDPTSDAGLIAEVITTGAETVVISPGAFGFNLEGTPTSVIPCRITNKSGSSSTVQVDLKILQLEA